MEPVAGNMNCIPRSPAFWRPCARYASGAVVLILDEVMTGFRFACRAPRLLHGIEADLTLGRSSAAACRWAGGKARNHGADRPLGPVKTRRAPCPATPLPWPPGWHTLDIIGQPGYEPLFARTAQLREACRGRRAGPAYPFTTNHAGTMFGAFSPPRNRSPTTAR